MSPGTIRAATERVLEKQAAQLAQWAALHFTAGKAFEAMALGDEPAARRWLYECCDLEYRLLGESDTFGPLVEELDPEGEHDPARKRLEGS